MCWAALLGNLPAERVWCLCRTCYSIEYELQHTYETDQATRHKCQPLITHVATALTGKHVWVRINQPRLYLHVHIQLPLYICESTAATKVQVWPVKMSEKSAFDGTCSSSCCIYMYQYDGCVLGDSITVLLADGMVMLAPIVQRTSIHSGYIKLNFSIQSSMRRRAAVCTYYVGIEPPPDLVVCSSQQRGSPLSCCTGSYYTACN